MNAAGVFPTSGRRMSALFVALLVAVSLVVGVPTSASAGSGRSGDGRVYPNNSCQSLGFTDPTRYNLGRGGGYVQVLYSQSQGSNCLQTINTTGVRRYTSIWLGRTSDSGDYAWDGGSYISRAGAVVLRNAARSCIDFTGYVNHNGGSAVQKRGVHCG